ARPAAEAWRVPYGGGSRAPHAGDQSRDGRSREATRARRHRRVSPGASRPGGKEAQVKTGVGLAVVSMLSCLAVAGCANGGRNPRVEIAADSACHDGPDLDYYYNSDAQPWVAQTFPNARGRTGIPAGARVLET